MKVSEKFEITKPIGDPSSPFLAAGDVVAGRVVKTGPQAGYVHVVQVLKKGDTSKAYAGMRVHPNCVRLLSSDPDATRSIEKE